MKVAWLGLLGLVTLGLVGCGAAPESAPAEATAASDEHAGHSHGHGHSHDGWWCPEHAVPEEVCGLCDPKVASDMKAKGDWCQEHDRPDSQCFACHPEAKERFAALYEAKYGKQPPEM